MLLTLIGLGLAESPGASPEQAWEKWCAKLPGNEDQKLHGQVWPENLVPRYVFLVCYDGLGGGITGPSPWNRWDHPLPQTEVILLGRAPEGAGFTWSVDGERGWVASETEGSADRLDAESAPSTRTGDGAGDYDVVNLHRFATGDVVVQVGEPGVSGDELADAVANWVTKLDDAAKKAFGDQADALLRAATTAADALRGKRIAEEDATAIRDRLDKVKDTVSLDRLTDALEDAGEPSPVTVADLTVQPSYTGALRVGMAVDVTPHSTGYAVGTAARAGGGELVVQEDEASPAHLGLVVGYSHYLRRRPATSVAARFSLGAGLSLVDFDGEELKSLSMGYLGPEISWPNFGVGLFVTARRVETLRDGLAVGDPLEPNTQESAILRNAVAPGVGIVVYAPELLKVKK